jgi:hypothetical protein
MKKSLKRYSISISNLFWNRNFTFLNLILNEFYKEKMKTFEIFWKNIQVLEIMRLCLLFSFGYFKTVVLSKDNLGDFLFKIFYSSFF